MEYGVRRKNLAPLFNLEPARNACSWRKWVRYQILDRGIHQQRIVTSVIVRNFIKDFVVTREVRNRRWSGIVWNAFKISWCSWFLVGHEWRQEYSSAIYIWDTPEDRVHIFVLCTVPKKMRVYFLVHESLQSQQESVSFSHLLHDRSTSRNTWLFRRRWICKNAK